MRGRLLKPPIPFWDHPLAGTLRLRRNERIECFAERSYASDAQQLLKLFHACNEYGRLAFTQRYHAETQTIARAEPVGDRLDHGTYRTSLASSDIECTVSIGIEQLAQTSWRRPVRK